MPTNARLFEQAVAAAERITLRQHELDEARSDFQRAIRTLYLDGASLREIAEGVDLSHQRVHQLLDLPRPKTRNRRVSCSFCNRERTQVTHLIGGANHIGICDGCVDLADTAIGTGQPAINDHASLRPTQDVSCSLCGNRHGDDSPTGPLRLVRSDSADGVVCTDCLDVCHQILDGRIP